jgi:REP element-mobilizing transposase RayT
MDRILDAARTGPPFLKQPEIAEIVHASLHHGAHISHYELHAWVIMPNHVHLLITPRVEVSRLLRSLKRATRANELLRRTGEPFWQDESYDHLVRDADEFRRIQNYIENNPVKACLAPYPDEYVYSSARRAESLPHF